MINDAAGEAHRRDLQIWCHGDWRAIAVAADVSLGACYSAHGRAKGGLKLPPRPDRKREVVGHGMMIGGCQIGCSVGRLVLGKKARRSDLRVPSPSPPIAAAWDVAQS